MANNGWTEVKLGDLGEINRGRSRHRPRYAPHLYGGPYPFIQTGDIRESGGRITRYTQTYSEAGLAQSRLWPAGTMCITIAANIAETALLTFPSCFPDSVVGFIGDESKCDMRFIEFMFRYLRRSIQHEATGSVQDNINLATLDRLRFLCPPLSEQRTIAGVLGALDDKIELNRRMNETLETLAQTQFQKMMEEGAGKPGKIEDLCTLSRETINPGEFPDESFDHYSIPAFDEGRLPKSETGESIKSNKFVVPANAAMISKLNPRIPRIWLPDVSTAHRSIASTEFLIAIPKPGISREWLYGLFASQAFLDVFATMITGTSGSHQRVKPEYLLAMDMEIPPAEAIQQYTKAAAPLHKRIALNLQESQTLAALRDALLPKLLSGAVRVKEMRS